MRKPLLLSCVVCCLLFSAATPLAFAEDRNENRNQDSPAVWGLGSWLSLAQLFHLPLLDLPYGTNIFNDGPEPVGSSEEEEESSEGESAPEDVPEGGPTPLETIVNPDLSSARD